jgi:hypothetical protein
VWGEVGTTPNVTSTSGDSSATVKPSSSAAWKASTGFMIWSAVTTAMTASGSRAARTAAGQATALRESRPSGSPRMFAAGSSGRSSATVEA